MKPDKERLKELKKEVDELLRCPMSVWNGTGYEEVDELTETGKDLLALIDAALAEPDADAAEAIGELEASLDEDFVVNGRINVFSTYQFKVETIDCIINKLRQYQKPTDTKILDAINKLTYARDSDREFDDGTFVEAIDTALACMRQMGSTKHSTDSTSATGCEICGNFKRVDCRADNLEFTAVYCPNCGRPLKGGE